GGVATGASSPRPLFKVTRRQSLINCSTKEWPPHGLGAGAPPQEEVLLEAVPRRATAAHQGPLSTTTVPGLCHPVFLRLTIQPSEIFPLPRFPTFLRHHRLTISYCRSSGPGGQNVNKVNSKAEVRFHLATAEWIPEPARQKMAITHKNKINKSGELILTSECSRYQFRNLADCLQKIRDMIAEASQPAKEPSKEDAVLHRIRIENMNRERLRKKRIHSVIKTGRRVDMD
uniref:Large ribosomal subunit protein mL62 n=1 Tax=Felis catus TaxID=9685 RepID=A0ABI8AKK5_FELCA